ncbi:MAG: SurA N-terminal domain-containing protein [Thiomicrospira sp.]
MLLAIREKVQGWIAWAIVIILIVPFALWGIDQYASGDKTIVVAEVNGEKITAQAFVQLYNRQKMRLQQQFGDLYDQVVEDQALRAQVLDSLIESTLIRQWAKSQGLVISDQQLSAVIQAADIFQDKGAFSQAIYQDILMRNGLTVAGFESEQRQFLLENQFRGLTAHSAMVTSDELEQLFRIQNQRRSVDYLRMDQRVFRDKVTVTDEQMKAYYDEHAQRYVEPEAVTVDYVVLSQENLAKSIEVDDEQAQAYYEANLAQYTQPEQRRARHILLRGEADAVKEKLAQVQAKLAAGEAFEALAEAYSEDPGSAANGGDLDYFEQGMMVPEFDQVVFAMQVGEVSEPVQTEFGQHIIQLVDIREQQTRRFDEVKHQVIEQVRAEQAEAKYFERLEALNTLAYEQPDSLEPLLSILDTQIQTSPSFTRDGSDDGWFALPKVIEAAYSDDVLKSRLNSPSIEVAPNTAIVLRVNTHTPAFQKTFAEVEAEIKAQLVREGSIAKARELAKDVMAKIEQGEAPESLVGEGVEWHPVGWLERQNQQVLPQITQTAFKAPKPVDGQPSWSQVELFSGDTVLVRVSAVELMDDEERRAQMPQLQQALEDVFAQSELKARLDSLREKAEINKNVVYETL